MNEPMKKSNTSSIVLNIIIGIAAVSAVVWLVTNCPTCH